MSDPQKRSRYDQFGHAAFDPSAAGGAYGDAGFDFSNMGGIGDIFETFFGGGGTRRNGPLRGNDITRSINISFEEAAFGCSKEIDISRIETCPECDGNGAKPGTSVDTCTICHGSGQVRVQQRTPFGTFASARPCESCGGSGKVIKDPCFTCKGKGRLKRSKKIEVKIPAVLTAVKHFNKRSGRQRCKRRPSGRLACDYRDKTSSYIERQGSDVILDLPITIVQAALGSDIEVPTLDGRVKYTVLRGHKMQQFSGLKAKEYRTYRLKEEAINLLRLLWKYREI